MNRTVMWFRRDLRLSDNPALQAAAQDAGRDGEVVALFCLDPRLCGPSGPARRAFLSGCLGAFDGDIGGDLVVRSGPPESVVPQVAAETGATSVYAAEDFGPYGRGRDERVARALADRGGGLVPVGSPYAVPPGEVVKAGGEPYKVFTPFSRAWRAHGWPEPAPAPRGVRWAAGVPGEEVPDAPEGRCPAPGGGRGRGAASGAAVSGRPDRRLCRHP